MICKNCKNNLGEKESSENPLNIAPSVGHKCEKFLQVSVTKHDSIKSKKS